jgi:hypothetical protein
MSFKAFNLQDDFAPLSTAINETDLHHRLDRREPQQRQVLQERRLRLRGDRPRRVLRDDLRREPDLVALEPAARHQLRVLHGVELQRPGDLDVVPVRQDQDLSAVGRRPPGQPGRDVHDQLDDASRGGLHLLQAQHHEGRDQEGHRQHHDQLDRADPVHRLRRGRRGELPAVPRRRLRPAQVQRDGLRGRPGLVQRRRRDPPPGHGVGRHRGLVGNQDPDQRPVVGKHQLVVDGARTHIEQVSLNNQTNLQSSVYFCRAFNNEFNYSSQPDLHRCNGLIRSPREATS